jgi:hypothetical protein
MNRPVVVAQASGPRGPSRVPTNVIAVNKPQGEQAITIHLDGSTKLDLTAIANENITLVHIGDRLIILFENHAEVAIDGFYGRDGQPLADLTVELAPGRDGGVTLPGRGCASLACDRAGSSRRHPDTGGRGACPAKLPKKRIHSLVVGRGRGPFGCE